MHDDRLSRRFARYREDGDLAALAEVFDAVSPELLRVARHVASRTTDPEDLVQATFLAAIERASSFDAERPLVPWLMGILINQSRLARRRQSHQLGEDASQFLSAAPMREGDAESKEIDEAVTRALSDLPDTYREVLVPHLAEGKKPHEIARALGRPQGTVRAQIHRGIRLLRKALPAGFALGALGVTGGDALAQVRARVLEAAARATGRDASHVPAAKAATLARAKLLAAGLLAVLGGALWFAWSAHGDRSGAHSPAAGQQPPAELGALHVGERPADADRRPASTPTEAESAARATGVHGSVLVHVVRGNDKAPVAGTRVTLLAWGDPHWYETAREARSDARGEARFERIHPGRIGIHLDGGPQIRDDVVAGRETRVEAATEAGIALDVVVSDEHGVPLAGAEVELYAERDGAPTARLGTTDASGHLAARDVDTRRFVGARAPSGAPTDLVWLGIHAYAAAGRATLVLEVEPSVHVAGVVHDVRGAPVARAAIAFACVSDGDRTWRPDGGLAFDPAPTTCETDVEGRFAFAARAGREGDLRVDAAGFARHVVRVDARAGEPEPLSITLAHGARLQGTMRFDDGSPAPSTRVVARADTGGPAIETRTDANGTYELSGVPIGRVEVAARAGGLGPPATTTLVVDARGANEWDAVVAHPETIQGTAIGEDGRLIRTWLVLAVPEDGSADLGPDHALARWGRAALPPDPEAGLLQCWVDPEGRFVVPCASGVPHRLELRPRQAWRGPIVASVSGVQPGARGVVIRVRKPDNHFVGRVVDPAGRPIGGARVVATSPTLAGDTQATTDATTGRFEITLVPGPYDVLVWPAGGVARSIGRHELPLGSRVDLGDVVVAPPGTLRLRDEHGSGSRLDLVDAAGARFELRRARHEPGVAWIASNLPAGAYRVRRISRDGSVAEVDVALEAGTEVEVAAPR